MRDPLDVRSGKLKRLLWPNSFALGLLCHLLGSHIPTMSYAALISDIACEQVSAVLASQRSPSEMLVALLEIMLASCGAGGNVQLVHQMQSTVIVYDAVCGDGGLRVGKAQTENFSATRSRIDKHMEEHFGQVTTASFELGEFQAGYVALGSQPSMARYSSNALQFATGVLGLVLRLLGAERWRETDRKTRLELNAALQAREEFINVAAHELRSPITAMRMQIERMGIHFARSPLAEELQVRTQKSVSRALLSCDNLVRLSDALLDVAQIQKGSIWLDLKPLNIVDVATQVIDRFQEHAEHKQCAMTLIAPPSIVGRWDAVRLGEVFTNLLANAIKYAPGTLIEVILRRYKDWVCIDIQDGGPGVPKEAQERVFGRFERAQPVMNSAGWGLGLHITRQIIDAHHGRVHICQQERQGCRMRVELPVNPHDVKSRDVACEAASADISV